MLRILFNLSPDVAHKSDRCSKTLLKIDFEFVPNRRDNTIALNLGLILLLIEVDPIPKKLN